MKGTFYGVSTGPGDPGLMTVEAVRVIEQSDIVAAPYSGAGKIAALEIVKKAVPGLVLKKIVTFHMPMTRDQAELREARETAARSVCAFLEEGMDIAFLTLGDISLYSTFSYLRELVADKGYPTKVIAGVPSFCAAAALTQQALVKEEEQLHVIPGSYGDITSTLDLPGTKVYMKSGRELRALCELIEQRGLAEQAVVVQNCGMENERVAGIRDTLEDSYFSIITVTDREA